MLRDLTLPATLSRVLDTLRSCFTAPTFETFTALVAGLVAQPVGRTVCGMLTGAGLAGVWQHCRAHRFFSAARWCPRQVGLVLAGLVVAHLLPKGAPITVAVDDTLFRRRGKKVHGAGWFHDGSAAGQVKLGYGNNWVVVAIIVTLPFCTRPVAVPVLATLAVKGSGRSKPDLARDLVDALAERFPDRGIHVVGDSAYGCGAFAGMVGAVVPVEGRTGHPGHAHQPPPPDHRSPISPAIPPTSHNRRNPGSPASLGPRRRITAKVERSGASQRIAYCMVKCAAAIFWYGGVAMARRMATWTMGVFLVLLQVLLLVFLVGDSAWISSSDPRSRLAGSGQGEAQSRFGWS